MSIRRTGLEIRLASRPIGWPAEEDFKTVEVAVPEPGDGQC
jgi:NADPH-dependent curcumin reductase CurA